MTIARVSIAPAGQSNGIAFSTLGISYASIVPGGWNATMIGSSFAESSWTGAGGWLQYVPGVTSYGTGSEWGPEAGIALGKRTLLPATPRYLFKYAVGGTGLCSVNALGQTWSPWSSGNVFDQFVAELTLALNALWTAGLTPVIDDLYWFGNESDTFAWASASAVFHDLKAFRAKFLSLFPTVAANMKFIVSCLKTDLGSASGPLPYVDLVQHCQRQMGVQPRCAWINMEKYSAPTVSLGHYNPVDIVPIGLDAFTAAESI